MLSITYNSLVLLTIPPVLAAVSAREPYAVIEPSYDPDWGDWNGGAICPDNTFAHGWVF